MLRFFGYTDETKAGIREYNADNERENGRMVFRVCEMACPKAPRREARKAL